MLNLYTETAFQVRPPTPASLIHIEVPSRGESTRKSKYLRENGARAYAKNEKTFGKQYLATQSSIYFRQAKTYPRTFLWRVLDEDRVLQIQCADLTRSGSDLKEAHLTLSLEFHNHILPSCVVLSDEDRGDVLYVYLITAARELYTLALDTQFFRSKESIPKDVREWCHSESPSSFTIDHPHHLYANHPFEIFVSFDSGRLQKLTRKADDYSWMQDNYDDKTWGASIRGIVSRRGNRAIEYGTRYFDPSTAHAIVASSDSTYVFTICLNHTLRIWNLATGKLVVSKDLLDKARQPNDHIQINPAEPGLLRLLKLDHLNHPILVTFSPQDGGQFKFWDVKGGLTSPLIVEDKFPDLRLSPPDPDPSGNTVWSLTGFEIRPGDNHRQTEFWVLWRNNNYHQLYSLHFDFFDLSESWKSNWVKATISPTIRNDAPDLVKADPQDVTSKWLEYLFYPSRYPTESLETALSIYQEAMLVRFTGSQKNKSLQERMCSVVAANVALRKYNNSDMDYERFVTDIDFQWRNFWRIVESINEGRFAPVSLCFDVFADMAWVMMADHCCAIRECSMTELMQHNDSNHLENLEEQAAGRWPHRKVSSDNGEPFSRISTLIDTAATFRRSFSADLAKDVEVAIEVELLQQPEYPVPFRLKDFYDRVNFGDVVTNKTYEQVEKDISKVGGISSLSNELFIAAIETLPIKTDKPKSALRSTIFASNLLSTGIQDVIMASRQLALDLLTLVVFLEGEMVANDIESVEFDASELFELFLGLLKEYEKNLWLVSHSRVVPLEFLGPDPTPNTSRGNEKVSWENGRVVTILEDAIGKAVRPQPVVDKPQMYLVTDLLEEIQAWIAGKDEISPEDGVVYVQCDLIVQGNIDLASDFQRFQPSTAWAKYVQARLFLARSEFSQAAMYFRKPAYSLACGKAVGSLDEMSAGLLSMMDVQSFNSGLPRYFQHVMSLFESVKAFSESADFARLALQSLSTGQKEPVPNFRSEVLSRLFTAELKCSQFAAAFDALIQFTDHALQKSSVVALVSAILDPTTSNTGRQGALKNLQQFPLAMHPHLARHVDLHLSALAKKQSSIPDTSAQWTGSNNVDYLQILHAMRVAQKDYRGAVSVLFDRLRLIRKSSKARGDPQALQLRHALLALINALSCVAVDEAYILAENDEIPSINGTLPNESSGMKKRKRLIVTLDDLRRQYQQLLDRCSRIERGDFEFDLGDGMSEDEDEDERQGQGQGHPARRVADTDAMET